MGIYYNFYVETSAAHKKEAGNLPAPHQSQAFHLNGTVIHIHIAAHTVHSSFGGVLPHIIPSAVAAFVRIVSHPDPVASRELGYVQMIAEPALAGVYHGSMSGACHCVAESLRNTVLQKAFVTLVRADLDKPSARPAPPAAYSLSMAMGILMP